MAEDIFHVVESLSSVDPKILRLSGRASKVSHLEKAGRRSWSNAATRVGNRHSRNVCHPKSEQWLIMSPNMRRAVDIVNNNSLET
ncbi:MAG: hypothetical protein WCC08_17620, partial [Terrimicrobiaceae bacterium]